MSSELRGLYITLLCVDWLNDGFHAGSILKLSGYEWMDKDGLLRGDSTEISDRLMECFKPHPTNPNLVSNPRLQRERSSQEEHRKERSESGKKGAKAKWLSHEIGNGSAIKEPLAKDGSSSSSASASAISTPAERLIVGVREFTKKMADDWLTEARKSGADYTEKEMSGAFLALKANGWMWGKNPVADHRAALERQIQTDRERNNYGTCKQNNKPGVDRNAGTYNEGKAHLYRNAVSGGKKLS